MGARGVMNTRVYIRDLEVRNKYLSYHKKKIEIKKKPRFQKGKNVINAISYIVQSIIMLSKIKSYIKGLSRREKCV